MKKSISTDLTQSNIDKVLAILADTPARLAELCARVPEDQAATPLADGERSLIEQITHLIYTEARTTESIHLALTLPDPLFLDVHAQRDLAKIMRFESFPLSDLMTYFRLRRAFLLPILQSLDLSRWSRTVRHEAKRSESVYWKARGQALHELEHLTDLESKLR